MRLIKVSAPVDKGSDISRIAFSAGIKEISVNRIEVLRENAGAETKLAIDLETSTPKAKLFVDALLAADFYNKEDFTINTRQPRSILSSVSLSELTRPLVEPATDILEELWQFSHITGGFIGRIFIAGGLLAFGLIHQQILIIIAGLLFLPLLPLLLAISFGLPVKQFKLAIQGIMAFSTAIVLLVLSGAAVAALSSPPIKYEEFNSLPVSLLISAAVGVAAGLASADDVGRRELIGLAATAQIAVIPVWFGICFVLGFPATIDQGEIITRAASFFLNILTIVIASLLTYLVLCSGGAKGLSKNRDL